uniref:Egg protein CP391B n=1 Tax=Schistosoma japonicum TaxID=6182 RepID=Q6PYV3_SCHJA|nr:egg protein CP391B [Schistosoma japonicum]
MKMRGSANQLVTCILTLVIFTGTTLTQSSDKRQFVQLQKKILAETSAKKVGGNATCEEHNHYYYVSLVCMNGILDNDVVRQVHDSDLKTDDWPNFIYETKFKPKFYGIKFDSIGISPTEMKVEQNSTGISNTVQILPLSVERNRLNIKYTGTEKFVAIQWPDLQVTSNKKQHTAKVIVVVYSDGRITIFYEDIPTEIDSKDLISTMTLKGEIYGSYEVLSKISIPAEKIKTGTVVHLTPAPKYCSKETSEQACRDASIHGVECYWCIKPEICTNKVDTNAYI